MFLTFILLPGKTFLFNSQIDTSFSNVTDTQFLEIPNKKCHVFKAIAVAFILGLLMTSFYSIIQRGVFHMKAYGDKFSW